MNVFVGMECSGVIRRAMSARGHQVVSADFKPAEDNTVHHFQGDVFEILTDLMDTGWIPDLAIFHPTCTYLTYAAEWAFSDGPYHQKLKSDTLTGEKRWEERVKSVEQCKRILSLPIERIALENPKGYLTKAIRKPRWKNQTDSGQSRLGPGENRATDRSRTYPGIAEAIANQWGLI
jgi:hypothetical protein